MGGNVPAELEVLGAAALAVDAWKYDDVREDFERLVADGVGWDSV